ncbi:MAG: radical SAM family heme chaperone HemW [Bdellovibrionota bacterium]
MLGVYVHFPFCHRLCPFCDFYVSTNTDTQLIYEYTQALVSEIYLFEQYQWKRQKLSSVYIGGGTPSLIPAFLIDKVLMKLSQVFIFSSETEITLECNPEDVHLDKALDWKRLGINRISLGVQSMDDRQLQRLGRSHCEKDVAESIRILRKAGFGNISVDLMYGLEHQTLDSWKDTLEKVLMFQPEHVSCYQLTIEEKTSFHQQLRQKKLHLPEDQDIANMMLTGRDFLADRAYQNYEVSNSARDGFASVHNMGYWTAQEYWGLGVSSHSFQNAKSLRRFANPRSLKQYMLSMQKGSTCFEEEPLEHQTLWKDLLLTGLRLEKGISLDKLQSSFGSIPEVFKNNIESLVQSHLEYRNGNLAIRSQYLPILNEVLTRIFD